MADLQGDEDCLGPPLLDGDDGYVVARGRGEPARHALRDRPGERQEALDAGPRHADLGDRGRDELPSARVPGGLHPRRQAREVGHARRAHHGRRSGPGGRPARRKVAWAALLAPSAGTDPAGSGSARRDRSRTRPSSEEASCRARPRPREGVVERRIDGGADLAAMDHDRFYVLGDELCAYSRRDRRLLWSRQFWGSVSRIVETRDHLYVMFATACASFRRTTGTTSASCAAIRSSSWERPLVRPHGPRGRGRGERLAPPHGKARELAGDHGSGIQGEPMKPLASFSTVASSRPRCAFRSGRGCEFFVRDDASL